MKVCVVCRESKDFSAFYGSTQSKDGYAYRCKECDRETRRRSRNGPGGEGTRRGLRDRKLQATYGITLAQYEAMLESQGGLCGICNTDNPYGEGQVHQRARMSFAVDHDHTTGQTRGLLCNLCNRALGFLQDDPQIVHNAWVYLSGHK
jgi:hypothetical protein